MFFPPVSIRPDYIEPLLASALLALRSQAVWRLTDQLHPKRKGKNIYQFSHGALGKTC